MVSATASGAERSSASPFVEDRLFAEASSFSFPASGATGPLSLDPESCDRLLAQYFRAGNRSALAFARLLLEVYESRFHLSLGFPNVRAYAHYRFRLGRSQVYEYLQVAKAVRSLHRLERACLEGRISWAMLAQLTRVATVESEEEWISFAAERGFERTRLEVRAAIDEKRVHPRRNGFGLPRLQVKLRFDLAPEEFELVHKALAKIAAEVGETLGVEATRRGCGHEESREDGREDGQEELGGPLDSAKCIERKDALLLLSRMVLESDAGVGSGFSGRAPSKDSPYALIYNRCPSCRRTGLATRDGVVEVPPEVVDRIEEDAELVTIDDEGDENDDEQTDAHCRDHGGTRADGCDREGVSANDGGEVQGEDRRPDTHSLRPKTRDRRSGANRQSRPPSTEASSRIVPREERDRPNDARLARKVKLRDSNCCAHCGSRGPLHSHHIKLRVEGGRTRPSNECALCLTCHALVHEGLLEIEGTPATGLEFYPRLSKLLRSLEEEARAEIARVPILQVSPGSSGTPVGPDKRSRVSGAPDGSKERSRVSGSPDDSGGAKERSRASGSLNASDAPSERS